MFDQMPHHVKQAGNVVAVGATGLSTLGTWFEAVQPIVAVISGVFGSIWCVMQGYDWVQKKLRDRQRPS